MTKLARRTIVLDDGEYFVHLANHQPRDTAVGFLERRCPLSDATPGGAECLGAFTSSADCTWQARIATAGNAPTDPGFRVVATGVSRLDAIVALWRSRLEAEVQFRGSR